MKFSQVAFACLLAACGGTVTQTRYYQLATPSAADPPASNGSVIAVEPLVADGAYDDERIVYRVDPVRLDYYQYHRWSTTPGAMVSSYLQQALGRSGRFRAVVRDSAADTAAVLGGRVVAIEEVDAAKSRWFGHVALELTLTDPKTGEILWSHPFDEREPLAAQTPEGLARALGVAMARIVAEAVPMVAGISDRLAKARGLMTEAPIAGQP
jgi:ABC-type uncharacterized transport system auxiliary subunit